LPYLNRGGVIATSPAVATCLVDRAVELADKLRVKFLELRHEQPVEHPALGVTMTSKVHMQLDLPASAEQLWSDLDAKVRNQIRKGQKQEFQVRWGTTKLLNDFYHVFSRNMRDLGTPVYSRKLFEAILKQFDSEAELCVIYKDNKPAAAALLIHGSQCTEVPSASALREYNSLNANMFMYWQLLERAVQRKQAMFDFGRSSIDSPTYRFKKQWGAKPQPATWQYYLRQGDKDQMRPSNKKFDLMSRAWRKLPLSVTRLLGPAIVRGVP
ncbi:MAG: FemAB family PEP-CTERM system-associated protein, partial [Planctomycetota bacterium]|nr:FemAB family PEP-CTERM system-associated protein [Planctomycetota bacterium]